MYLDLDKSAFLKGLAVYSASKKHERHTHAQPAEPHSQYCLFGVLASYQPAVAAK